MVSLFSAFPYGSEIKIRALVSFILVSALTYNFEATRQRFQEGMEQEKSKLQREKDKLAEAEEKYRTILESIEDGYYEMDMAGDLTFFNDSLCRIHGYSRDELMGMNNRRYTDPETLHELHETFDKITRSGRPDTAFDWGIIRKDGAKRCLEASASLMKDQADHKIGFRGILRDVTEKKQTESELIHTKNFLKNIVDSSIDGIISTDLDGQVIYTSPRSTSIMGYGQEEVIGKKVSSFYAQGQQDAKAIMKALSEKGELRDYELKLMAKGGELIDINVSGSLLIDEKGEVIGTLGIFRDITEKNELILQLQRVQKLEALGTLAGGIAHNFNNLLMGIMGNTSLMLLETGSTHPNFERLKTIEKQVQSGSKLTAQLLGYAREGQYEIKPINLNQLVGETSDTFGTARKEIEVQQDCADELFGIEADEGQIEQVLLNLYVNAADAMAGGGVMSLKTMNVTHENMKDKPYMVKPGNYVLLTVADSGTGMDKKTMERIFEPFFTTKGLGKGTGLGLASVYGIIKAHGGYIDVNSDKGRGTTFSIYLPASEREVEKYAKGTDQIVEGEGAILVVDDEDAVLDVGTQLLNALGYEVLAAGSGKEAIEVYNANIDKIDMVILDMVMPGMGGGETFDRLKKINSGLKVLLSSGYSIDGQADEILTRGCNGFIQKPFNMKLLSQRVSEILDKG